MHVLLMIYHYQQIVKAYLKYVIFLASKNHIERLAIISIALTKIGAVI